LATALVAAVAFAAGSAVVARATAPPAEIYACVNNNSGTVRIVGAKTTCNKAETSLTWNTQGPRGEMGPQGPEGPRGDTGSRGQQGPSGISGYEVVFAGAMLPRSSYAGDVQHKSVTCPEGKFAIGGGFNISPREGIVVTESAPASNTTWSFGAVNQSPGEVGAGFYVVCVDAR
ncbi:MAG TPA: hypothetical protein VFL91_32020, partial [Thermomicrobiales bacterium]|nr:hypothetical protein [Thermomicrobiales bacterium]